MKIRIKSSRRRSGRITLNMASMVDAAFLLLAYFLLTMVITPPEDRLSPTIQTESREAGPASDFQPQKIQVLMIDGEPAYQLAARKMQDRAQLLDVLRELPKDAGVFVHVADGVPVGFAVSAIQVARDAGFKRVTYVPAK